MKRSIKNIVLIAGGVGGAKLAEGLNSIKDINLVSLAILQMMMSFMG